MCSVIALKHFPLLTQVLSKLYTQTLSALQRLPKDAAYRHHTEQVVQQRLQVVQAETSIPTIEEKIGCGQVEELIDQVRRCGLECVFIREHGLGGVSMSDTSTCVIHSPSLPLSLPLLSLLPLFLSLERLRGSYNW